jgi:hypothetical protein
VLADRVEALEDEARASTADEFAAGAEAWLRRCGHADERLEGGVLAAELMADFRVHYLGESPTGWTVTDLDEFLLDWIPRKISLDESEIALVLIGVGDVFRYLGATDRLPARLADELCAHTDRLTTDFAEAMSDPSLRGPAKAIVEAMNAEGVEIGDPDALQAWLSEFNARPLEEREQVLGPAPIARASESTGKRKAKTRKMQRQARKRGRKRTLGRQGPTGHEVHVPVKCTC